MELDLDLNKRYTFADYLTWVDDKRRELIDGIIKIMTPAPSTRHQTVSVNLATEIKYFLKKKKCKIFASPFDVRLPNDSENSNNKIFTVVQPDICVICDLSKLDEKGCLRAPDLIIEIVYPSNANHDVEKKFQLYEKHKVHEYWIVFPHENTINVFLLDENYKYQLVGMFAQDSKVPVNIFNGDLIIDLTEIFED